MVNNDLNLQLNMKTLNDYESNEIELTTRKKENQLDCNKKLKAH